MKLYMKTFCAGLIIGIGLIGAYITGNSVFYSTSFTSNVVNTLALMACMLCVGGGMEWLFYLHAHRKG